MLRLPAAAQSPVKLHDGSQLCAPRARKQQLLIEKLLVRDQNFQIICQPGVIAQARQARSVAEGLER